MFSIKPDGDSKIDVTRNISDPVGFPLSAGQIGIWFAQQINPSSPTYNIGEYIAIHGPIDPGLFEQALRQVVIKSEALCVRIVEHPDGPRQVVGEAPAWSMPFIDVSGAPDPRAEAETWMKADLACPVDPTRGPLFSYALFRASPDRFFWYARYHHIVMDGLGMALVARRLADIYTRLSVGPAALGGAFGTLADLLDEDAAYVASEQFSQDRHYWIERLTDRPEQVSLGGERTGKSGGFIRHTVYLPRSIAEQLEATARHAGASLPHLIAAATAIFLHRLTGATDVTFGLPVAARSGAARRIPGMVSNVLPLRLAVQPRLTVSEVIGRAARQIRDGLEHQRFQIADLRRELGGIDDARSLFGLNLNIMRFDYGFDFAGHRAQAKNLSLGPVEDLSIQVYDRLDGGPLQIDFDANPAIHSADDVADRQQRFLRLLTALADSGRTIASLDILTAGERRTILHTWNEATAAVEPAREIPAATLPELFARRVAQSPDAIAVVFGDASLSYRELDERSSQLAHHLQAQGVAPETIVGLCVERSPEMLIGLLGILKAGGAYLPLDPAYPPERLAFMLADAGVVTLVTQSTLLDRLPAHGMRIVRLDADRPLLSREPTFSPRTGSCRIAPPTSSTPRARPETQRAYRLRTSMSFVCSIRQESCSTSVAMMSGRYSIPSPSIFRFGKFGEPCCTAAGWSWSRMPPVARPPSF